MCMYGEDICANIYANLYIYLCNTLVVLHIILTNVYEM